MQRPKNFSTPCVAGTVALFIFVSWLTLFLWRTFIPNYDLEWDTRNAFDLLHHGAIPMHGGLASYLVFNPPGITFGMLPGVLMSPHDPALAERVSSLLLLALTLAGIYVFVAKRFGPMLAFLSAALYSLSATGLYFADSLRPRAHPVFLIWLIFLLDKWVNEKSRVAIALAILLYFAATYWLMEFVPAILLFAFVWIIYRPPLPRLALAIAIFAGLLLWSPYFVFESQRGFKDLRALITRQSAVADYDAAFRNSLSNPKLATVEGHRPHDLRGGKLVAPNGTTNAAPSAPQYEWVTDDRVGWCYRARQETMLEGAPGIWLCPSSTGEWWFATRDGNRWFNAKTGWTDKAPVLANAKVPSAGKTRGWFGALKNFRADFETLLLASFPECNWRPGPLILAMTACACAIWLAISALFARRSRAPQFFRWTTIDPAQRASLALLCAAGILPWLVIAALVDSNEADFARRFLWLWVALAPFIVVTLQIALRNFHPAIARAAAVALILLAACNPTMNWKARALATNHFRPAPASEFHQVIDFVAGQAKAEGRTSLSIGYDIPFLKWIVCARAADGRSKIGSQYDSVFLMRYGITNTDANAEGILPTDDFRIVEQSSAESWRQTYFDLSDYPRMDIAFEIPGFMVLRKPAN